MAFICWHLVLIIQLCMAMAIPQGLIQLCLQLKHKRYISALLKKLKSIYEGA